MIAAGTNFRSSSIREGFSGLGSKWVGMGCKVRGSGIVVEGSGGSGLLGWILKLTDEWDDGQILLQQL